MWLCVKKTFKDVINNKFKMNQKLNIFRKNAMNFIAYQIIENL